MVVTGRARRRCARIVGASLCFLILGCGASTAEGPVHEDRVHRLQWGFLLSLGRKSFKVRVDAPACAYSRAQPKIDHVEQMERLKSTVVTVFVKFPAKANMPEMCAGLEKALYERVKLSRPLVGQVLLDGSTSPPDRRWP